MNLIRAYPLIRAAGLIGVIALTVPDRSALGQQSPKTDRTGEKAPAKYQVDFRLKVSSQLDKQRVVTWINMLKELGAAGVSQVPGEPVPPKEGELEEPIFESGGAGRVIVRAMLSPSGSLFIGSDGYRIADRARLATLMRSIQAAGVPGPDPASPMWGLSHAQMDLLQGELRQASQFEFKDETWDAFFASMKRRVKLPVKLTPEAQELTKGLRLSVATKDVSLGAALSYLLQQHRLAWEPRQEVGGGVAILIMPLEHSNRPWPVGLPPEQLPGNVAPNLMANARYQTNNIPIEDVLAVFRRELKMDVLLDRAGLMERGVNPDQLRSTIQIPSGTFMSAIRKTLAPMGLRFELRIDEANRAFLWVTWSEPTGPAPKKKP